VNDVSPDLQGKPFYFDDCVVGAEHAAASHTVTAQDIISFARTWDPQPWHIDEEFARASHFGGLTACSAHIFSIFCITSQRWQSGVVQQAIAGLGFDEMRMHQPVYAGDTLRCVSRVDAARASASKPDRGIVIYHTQLINQNNAVVFSIKASTLMARDPATIRGLAQ
jgi:acyl dehydratase